MERTNCNLCQNNYTDSVFQATDKLFSLPGIFSIVKCRNCGLAYVNPRPNQEEIGAFYPPDKYYTFRPPARGSGLKSMAKRLIRESMPGYDKWLSPTKKYAGKLLGLFFAWQIDVLVPYREGGSILDVGCGNGQHTGWMVNQGWDVYGVDLSPLACKQAQKAGLNTFCGELAGASYPSDYFDVVVVNHVLEHVCDPAGLLRECRRVLKPGGLIIVDVPNFGCFDAKLFGPNWSAIDAPRHLYHFTKQTLKRIIESSGFEITHWKLKLPFPLLDRTNIRNLRRDASYSFWAIAHAYTKCYLIKPMLMLSSKGRVRGSINITAYGTKR